MHDFQIKWKKVIVYECVIVGEHGMRIRQLKSNHPQNDEEYSADIKFLYK